MSVSDRLRAILKTPTARLEVQTRVSQVADASLEDALGGEWQGDGPSRCFLVQRRFEGKTTYGCSRIQDFGSAIARGVPAASLLAGGTVDHPMTFFDLETTGLNGGAGTLAFLVGCGSFGEDGSFRTRQYLLVGDERAMLTRLADDFRGAATLVSFNGKSFDAPLLEMRHLFHRLPWRGREAAHLDVLHPSRRFWRSEPAKVEGDCSLATLEQKVLRARRAGDVPGCEIPARYFHFLRTGDARVLEDVLEHNRRDLLSLAGLTARLLHLIAEGPQAARDGREALALGRVYAAARLESAASAAYERALGLGRVHAELRIEALRALAEINRRARQHDRAAACWQQLLQLDACPGQVAQEAAQALAIHHEHRVRDLPAAKAFALRSLEVARAPSRTGALQYRLDRIDRKLRSLDSQSRSAPRLQL